jgi:hypothetical protein
MRVVATAIATATATALFKYISYINALWKWSGRGDANIARQPLIPQMAGFG